MTMFPQQRWEMQEPQVCLALSSKLSHPQSSICQRTPAKKPQRQWWDVRQGTGDEKGFRCGLSGASQSHRHWS